MPLQEFSRNIVKYPQNTNLADERFNEPKSVDVLLGAGIFYELLKSNKINLYLRRNKFGLDIYWFVKIYLQKNERTVKAYNL